jgi:hypothetical protein
VPFADGPLRERGFGKRSESEMDLRQTEKKIWAALAWLLEGGGIADGEWRTISVRELKTRAESMGWMKTLAQRKRFDIALERVRKKIFKNSK